MGLWIEREGKNRRRSVLGFFLDISRKTLSHTGEDMDDSTIHEETQSGYQVGRHDAHILIPENDDGSMPAPEPAPCWPLVVIPLWLVVGIFTQCENFIRYPGSYDGFFRRTERNFETVHRKTSQDLKKLLFQLDVPDCVSS